MFMTQMEAQTFLKKHGLRTTKDRCALLQLFAKNRTWTVAELHDELPHADLSTIYRNVTALIDKQLLSEAAVKGKESRYELADRKHHAHLVCGDCGTAYCIPCPIEKMNHEHSLEIFETCDDCRQQIAS